MPIRGKSMDMDPILCSPKVCSFGNNPICSNRWRWLGTSIHLPVLVFFVWVSGIWMLSSLSFAETVKPNVSSTTTGFFFDAKSNRYFSDGKTEFKLRPVGEGKDIERIEVSVDEEPFEAYHGKIAFKTEGLHLIRFRAIDPVLNWSPLQDFRIYVDQTPPTTALVWSGEYHESGGKFFVSPSAQIQLLSQDALSGVLKVIWEEQSRAIQYKEPLVVKKSGEYQARFHAVDHVGNTEEWHDVKYQVDSTPPLTKLQFTKTPALDKDKAFINGESLVVLQATDDAAGVKEIYYQINQGPVSLYHSPFPLPNGSNEIKYHAKDWVGNKEGWKVTQIYQDTTPPQISFERKGNYLPIAGRIYCTPGLMLTINTKDSESGLADISYSTDGKNFQKMKGNQISFTTPGETHLMIKASDRVGNVMEASPAIIIVDNEAPQTELVPNQKLVDKSGYYLSPIPNQVDFSSKDSGVGLDRIEISYDNKDYLTLKAPIDLAQWSTPKRTLFYRGVDRLGNREQPKSLTIQVRSEAPKVELMIESGNLPDVPLSNFKKKGGGS